VEHICIKGINPGEDFGYFLMLAADLVHVRLSSRVADI
jgi:hypothetical protein